VPDSALATFAAELKAWRERMGFTQNAFADKIGYSLALVSAVESGTSARKTGHFRRPAGPPP
jgi:transcriptional regulator with XRE-family HTH domain